MVYKDIWLSQYFEGGAYRCESPYNEQEMPQGFIYAKVPLENTHDVNFLIQKGFKAVEVLVQFEQNKLFPYKPQAEFQIEVCSGEDKNDIVKIAETAFKFSRFSRDEEIVELTANQIKADWVANYFEGQRGDKMIVAREGEKVVGFLLLINKSTIDLIAVADTHKGRGIALSLIGYANQNIGLLNAGTQLINKPSVNLYEKSGFTIKQSHYILHRHVK